MTVRTFSKVTPLSMTDLLVTYTEDGVTKNIIVADPELTAACWGLQAQQASAQKTHDSAVMSAQSAKNDMVAAADAAHQAALAAAQRAFTQATETAAQVKASALVPVQDQIDTVTAQVFAAANELLPPVDPTDAPATTLTPSAPLVPRS